MTTTRTSATGFHPRRPFHPFRSVRRARRGATAVAVAGLVLAGAACSGSVVHTYRTFSSALERGAPCSELFAQRDRFDNAETLAKIDADLRRIGCTSADAKRTDR